MGMILQQLKLIWTDNVRRDASHGLLTVLALLLLSTVATPQTPAGKTALPATAPSAAAKPAAASVDDSARLITEFEVNGLKVLREASRGQSNGSCRTLLPRRVAQYHGRKCRSRRS